MKHGLGLSMLLAAALACMVPAPGQTTPAGSLIERAHSLEARGRTDLAAQAWRQVLLTDPNNTEALAALARFARQNGKTEESESYLARLRKVDPHNPAIAQVETLPAFTQHRAQLKEAARLAGIQQFDQAMRLYREVFGDNPPPGDYAIAYYETEASVPGGWEVATAGLQKLMEKYPESEDYRFSLGRLWTYRPETRLAGIKLLEEIKANPGLVNRAQQAWRQALLWESSNPQVVPSMHAYVGRYPDPELQKVLQKTAPARPAAPRSPSEGQGYIALKADSLKEAEMHFQAAIKESPHSFGALAGMGYVRMKQQDFAGAIEYFEAAGNENPQDKNIIDALETARFWKTMKEANAAFDTGKLADAAALYRQATEMRPNSPEAVQGLGGSLMKMGDWAASAPVVEKLVELQPENAEAWRNLINSRYHTTGADSALATARAMSVPVQETLSHNVDYLAMMAAIDSDLSKDAESRAYLQQAVDLANTKGMELPLPLQLQFAGLYLRHHLPSQAAKLFQRTVDANPGNVDAWEGLMAALVQLKEEGRAMRAWERMPKPAAEQATRRPAFLRSLAAIQLWLGRLDTAEEYLRRSIELDTSTETREAVAAQLQLAYVWLRRGEPRQAEALLRQMVSSHPDDPDVWKALIAALHQEGRDQEAINEDARIPPDVSVGLRSDPDFVRSLAASQDALGHGEEALRLVRRSMNLLAADKRPIPAALEIQLAWLLLNTEGDEKELYTVLRDLGNREDLAADEQKANSDIWSAWTMRRADAALAAGDRARGIAILEAASRMLPKDDKIHAFLAGTLVKSGEMPRALEVYKSWGLTGANASDYAGAIGAALSQDNHSLAVKWLESALDRWPNNPQLLNLAGKQAASAGNYTLAKRYWKAALVATPVETEMTKTTGTAALAPLVVSRNPAQVIGELLLGEQVPEVQARRKREAPADVDSDAGAGTQGAPSQTLTPLPPTPRTEQPSPQVAPKPAQRSTSRQRPGTLADGTTLMLAADNRYEAMPQVANATPAKSSQADNTATDTQDIKVTPPPSSPDQIILPDGTRLQMVADQDVDGEVLPPISTNVADDRAVAVLRRSASSNGQSGQDTRMLTALLPDAVSVAIAPGSADPSETAASLRHDVQADLDGMASRNAPYFATGGNIMSRSGEAGFEQLVIQQADLQSSFTVGGRLRVVVDALPTYLDAGTPDGLSQNRFGLLPQGSVFPQQSAGGIGGEVQMSTSTFGLMAGSTPRNFLTPNFIGGIRFRPANGPITFLAERQTVDDSMLSYAGVRDPVTNRVWGGVIADTFSILGNWGGAKSGFYAGFDFQSLTGKGVESNQRVDGDLGNYWRVFGTDTSSLTVGFNLTAMHYEKNLRFYTLGQGGYFSPQRYMLFNVPLRYHGVYKRNIQYAAMASLGAQHFDEDASPYFPTLAILQGPNGSYYPKQSSSGANYAVDVRLGYQLTPYWYLGAWGNFNNARNYDSQSAGVSLIFSTLPRPMSLDSSFSGIPDWRGAQPFALR